MKRTGTIMALLALAAVALFSAGGTANAVLQDVSRVTPGGPVEVDPTNGFPLWYIDTNGVALEQCNFSAVQADLFCTAAGPAAAPIGGIDFAEAFYANATASPPDQGNISGAIYSAALEAAFATADGEPAAGQQAVFTRIRIRANVALAGTYTVTHPFGQNSYTVAAGGRINDTVDIPPVVALDFVTAVTGGSVGPFLKCIGAPLSNPANPGALYIGDDAVACAINGPLGINAVTITGPGTNTSTGDFFISGRIAANVPVTPITVTSATFSCDAGGFCLINVAAASDPTATVTVTPVPAGAFTAPLVGDGLGNFSGQAPVPAVFLPGHVSVAASMVGRFSAAVQPELVDQVTITEASFNSATGILAIKAASGDVTATLASTQFGPMTGGAAFFDLNGESPAPVTPPLSVTVVSSSGGSAVMPVTTVNVPETITAPRKNFRKIPKRYVIFGTGAPGAAVTVKLVGGPNDGQIIGTAIVDAAGNWSIRRTVAEGAPRPRLTTRISITSSGNASIASTRLRKL